MTIAIIVGLASVLGVWYLLDRIERHCEDSYLNQEMQQHEKFQRAFNRGDK